MISESIQFITSMIGIVIAAFFIVNYLSLKKKSKWNFWIIVLIGFVFYVVFKIIPFLNSWHSFTILASYIVSIFLLSNDKLSKKLLAIFLLFFIYMGLNRYINELLYIKIGVPSGDVNALLGSEEGFNYLMDLIHKDNTCYAIFGVVNIGYVFILMTILLIKNRKEYKGIDIFLIIFFITLFSSSTSIFAYFYLKDFWCITIMLSVSIVAVFIMIYSYKKMQFYKLYYEQEAELTFLKDKEQMQFAYYNDMLNKELEIRKLNHDLKNNIQVMYSLKKEDEKEKLMFKINEKLKQNEIVKYSKIEILNVILNLKKKEAEKNNIDLTIEIRNSIDFMEEIDISNLFSNILDNAIENIGNDDKKIELIVYKKMNYLVVKCSNTTSKSKKKINKGIDHGYGLKIINDIAKKYNGEVNTENNNSLFEITVFIAEE